MKKTLAAFVLLLAALLAGCTANPYTGERQMAKTLKYGMVASGAGAVVGALIGGRHGALIGAGVGALAGGAYGGYTDVQEKKLRKSLQGSGIKVERNNDRSLSLIVPADITFDTGNANIQSNFYQYLNTVAASTRERNGRVLIVGHTDNVGSQQLNEALSVQRARSVADYLMAQGVPFASIEAYGAGYTQPIASNNTAQGRAKNRRVEIKLL